MNKYKNAISCEIIESRKGGVSLGWWIFWLVICMPVLVITLLIHITKKEKYRAAVKMKDGGVEFTDWITGSDVARIREIAIVNS